MMMFMTTLYRLFSPLIDFVYQLLEPWLHHWLVNSPASLLQYKVYHNSPDLEEYLQVYGHDCQQEMSLAFARLCQQKHVDRARLLLRYFAIHGKKKDGADLISHHFFNAVIIWDQVELLRDLVANGFDVNSNAPNGYCTPLESALFHNSLPMVQALIDLGADVNKTSWDGSTPLDVAVKINCPEIIAHLLQRGALLHGKLMYADMKVRNLMLPYFDESLSGNRFFVVVAVDCNWNSPFATVIHEFGNDLERVRLFLFHFFNINWVVCCSDLLKLSPEFRADIETLRWNQYSDAQRDTLQHSCDQLSFDQMVTAMVEQVSHAFENEHPAVCAVVFGDFVTAANFAAADEETSTFVCILTLIDGSEMAYHIWNKATLRERLLAHQLEREERGGGKGKGEGEGAMNWEDEVAFQRAIISFQTQTEAPCKLFLGQVVDSHFEWTDTSSCLK